MLTKAAVDQWCKRSQASVCVKDSYFEHTIGFERSLILLYYCNARNSAIADKLRDLFRGQLTSPNMVPFDILGMVSYYSPIHVATLSDFKNAVTLKTGL